MADIMLITGGSRSGKSAYARRTAEALPGPRVFVATCPAVDAETAERIRKHQLSRTASRWDATLEEFVDIAGALRGARDFGVVLVDCLTLWVNNLMREASHAGGDLTEEVMVERCRELAAACEELPGTVIFVTNEVGMGIVPDNPASRRFSDLAGRCNQVLAERAATVTWVACGLPLHLKNKGVS